MCAFRLFCRLHNEELKALYSSQNIVPVIRSRKMRSAWLIARSEERRGEERCVQDFGGGDLRERDHLEDAGLDERIILKTDLQEVGWEHRLD
jgi:hypothetical protein